MPANADLRKRSAALLAAVVALHAPTLALAQLRAAPVARPALGAMPTIPLAPAMSAAAASPAASALPAAAAFAAPAAPAAAPAAAAAEIGAKAVQAAAMIEAAGPVANAASGDAKTLGAGLQQVLEGDAAAQTGSAVEAPASSGGSAASALVGAMRDGLRWVASLFKEHYAPIGWKAKGRRIDFDAEERKAAAKIGPSTARPQFHEALAEFVASAQDYHGGISFHAKEAASVPLTVLRGSDGKFYISAIDRAQLPEAQFPYKVGDEVVSFAGRPTAQAAALFVKAPNTAETDARLSELQLTRRARRRGQPVPQGALALQIRSRADGATHDVSLDWKYTPESISQDVPVRQGVEPNTPANTGLDLPPGVASHPLLDQARGLLAKGMPLFAHPLAGFFMEQAAMDANNTMAIGGQTSFASESPLGEKVWELPREVAGQVPFRTFIYKNPVDGRRTGYIRISSYMGDQNAARVFGALIKKFSEETDALVIDQVNNPGGNMFYMYALLSMLTDKPLQVPKHHVAVSEEDANWAASVIEQSKQEQMKRHLNTAARELRMQLGAEENAVNPVVKYAEWVLKTFKANNPNARLTEAVDLYGVGEIPPSGVRYTKPIVVLTNELDFSAGDFFPAILQDNIKAGPDGKKRVMLFGTRTAGAGGGVKVAKTPNQVGIEQVAYTWTLAKRKDGTTIENLGVQPDVKYEITADDIANNYAGYAKKLNETLAGMVPADAPRAEAPSEDQQQTPRRPRARPVMPEQGDGVAPSSPRRAPARPSAASDIRAAALKLKNMLEGVEGVVAIGVSRDGALVVVFNDVASMIMAKRMGVIPREVDGIPVGVVVQEASQLGASLIRPVSAPASESEGASLAFGAEVSKAHRALFREAMSADPDALGAYFMAAGRPFPGFINVAQSRDDSPGAATVVTRVIYTLYPAASLASEELQAPFWMAVDVMTKKVEFFSADPTAPPAAGATNFLVQRSDSLPAVRKLNGRLANALLAAKPGDRFILLGKLLAGAPADELQAWAKRSGVSVSMLAGGIFSMRGASREQVLAAAGLGSVQSLEMGGPRWVSLPK